MWTKSIKVSKILYVTLRLFFDSGSLFFHSSVKNYFNKMKPFLLALGPTVLASFRRNRCFSRNFFLARYARLVAFLAAAAFIRFPMLMLFIEFFDSSPDFPYSKFFF